jgi:AraC-like DNA-binding protein/quercetin dioxygenase-like cupin family protein
MDRALLKEKIPHGNNLFPLEVHEIETDIRLRERIGCHWHEELEFLVVTEGGADFHIDAGSCRVSAGELLFVNSNRLHSATSIGNMPCRFFAVVFSPALLSGYASDSIQQKYIDPVLNAQVLFPEHIKPGAGWEMSVLSILSEIKNAYQEKGAAYELYIKTKLYELWYLLYSNSDCKDPAKSSDDRVTRIKSILEYIDGNSHREIRLAELAGIFHMSEGYFCRFFKSMVKMSVIDYVNSHRINASVALLKKTDREIGEIAGMAGFNNISYFNRVFRRHMHCSPTELRNGMDKA